MLLHLRRAYEHMCRMSDTQRTSDTLRKDALRLAAEVGSDPRTATSWLKREQVPAPYDYAFTHAAKKLGIDRVPDEERAAS